jgi:hypothetical protein
MKSSWKSRRDLFARLPADTISGRFMGVGLPLVCSLTFSLAPAGLSFDCALRANVLQRLFAQDIGIAFARLCKIDDDASF